MSDVTISTKNLTALESRDCYVVCASDLRWSVSMAEWPAYLTIAEDGGTVKKTTQMKNDAGVAVGYLYEPIFGTNVLIQVWND